MSALGVTIGAEGYIGIALEATRNTYTAPTKFFPIRSESLTWNQNTNWRRVIRGTADIIGAVAGNGSVEGNVDMELLSDVLPYFLLCARGELTKEAATLPEEGFRYTFTPLHGAQPANTMSITVVRGAEAFGYVGCAVSSMVFGVDNDMATVAFTVLGSAENDVAVPATPTYGDDFPFGSGNWSIEVPVATQVFDADGFSFEINDNGTIQNRLKSSLGAEFIAYGERNLTLSLDRDFNDRDEYNNFKSLTERSVRVALDDNNDNNKVEFDLQGAIIDGYAVNLSSVGDLVRSSTTYMGTAGTTGQSYEIGILTAEDVTIPA